MSTVEQIAKYLNGLCDIGCGKFDLKLCTRGMDSLRPSGKSLGLAVPVFDVGVDHGKMVVFLRADSCQQ